MSGELFERPPEPFRIGLRPVALADWLRVDARLPNYLREKARLNREDCATVFAETAGSAEAQRKALSTVEEWLVARGSPFHEMVDNGCRLSDNTLRREVEPHADDPPLLRAAMLVAEDLAIMRSGSEGWTLAAAAIHFPSSWRLSEKVGLPMRRVHDPVPGFGTGTRHAALIERIFDHLPVDAIVERGNWAVHETARLHLPEREHVAEPTDRDAPYYREERQTLRRLDADTILFSIDITVAPVRGYPKAAKAALDEQIAAMTPEQREYRALLGAWGKRIGD